MVLEFQGHVQVVLNMSLFGMNPQQALDAPRFCVGPGSYDISEIHSVFAPDASSHL